MTGMELKPLSPEEPHIRDPRTSAAPNAAVPPHPFDARWYAHVDGQTYGPYSGHEIRRMVQQRQILEMDFLCLEGESAWVQAKNDPIIGAVFADRHEIRTVASSALNFGRSTSSARSSSGPIGLKRTLVAFLLIALSWFAWPYYAVYDLAMALRERDVAKLENRVAWDGVRQGLRDDLNTVFLQRLRTDVTSNNSDVSTGIAALLGPAVIDRVVDAYLTPQGIANLIGTGKTPNAAATGKGANTGGQQPHFSFSQLKHAFFFGGPFTFAVEIVPENDSDQRSLTMLLKWNGDWRLTRIVFPLNALAPETIQAFSSGARSPESYQDQNPVLPPNAAAVQRQKVVLYEENPNDPAGKRYAGTAMWHTDLVPPFAGQPSELAVLADIEIPEQKMSVRWLLRPNEDKAVPASHIVEVVFTLPPDFPHDGITNVPGMLMKQSEMTRGVPLAALAVKVRPNFFLIGLSSVAADRARNVQLLRERGWFDIPVVYDDGRRAIISIEKGNSGERVFVEAFKSWGDATVSTPLTQSPAPAAPPQSRPPARR
jgi:Protein of unknown function (DUF2939)/GYF domain 2